MPLFPRPGADIFQLLHRVIGEFGFGTVAANHKHQSRVLAVIRRPHVFEPPNSTGRKGNDIEWIEVDRLDLTALVFPRAAPNASHRNKSLVGVVVVHHRTFARLGAAISEIKALRYRNGGESRR